MKSDIYIVKLCIRNKIQSNIRQLQLNNIIQILKINTILISNLTQAVFQSILMHMQLVGGFFDISVIIDK